MIHLRTLKAEDLSFAEEMRARLAWNQTTQDWKRYLACEPDGCFLAEWHGLPVGTAIVTCYGTKLGWIGMLLVDPEYRRLGIGSALLQRCLDYLASRTIRCVKLDATPLGRTLYERFGFLAEWPITRWELSFATAALTPKNEEVEPWTGAHFESIADLDEAGFGVRRLALLRELARQSTSTIRHGSTQESTAGFGMLRSGTRAHYLGPVAARSPSVAEEIVRHLLSTVKGEPVFWDVPDGNAPASSLARQLNFSPQRSLFRMFLGENTLTVDPTLQFAIADPAVG